MATTYVDGAEVDVFEKRAGERLDYQVNWAPWLKGAQLSTSAFMVPTGLKKIAESNGVDTATIWVEGGTRGRDYVVLNQVTTMGSPSRIKIHVFVIRII